MVWLRGIRVSGLYLLVVMLGRELAEAEELLLELESWTEEEISELPELYQEKAREFRRLTNSGEE